MNLIIEISCRGVSGTRRISLQDGEEIVVGRDKEEFILARDQTLSRQHFRLGYHRDSIVVTHLSRTNPTLVAPEDSSDFQKVIDSQIEPRTCRIIAGSHRFVATIETPESATISGNSHEIWSDLDEDDSLPMNAFEDERRPPLDAEQRKNDSRKTFRTPVPTEEGPVFIWDDSVSEKMDSATITDRPSTQPKKQREILPNGPSKPDAETIKPEPQKSEPATSEAAKPETDDSSKRQETETKRPELPNNFIPQDDDFFD